MTLPPPVPVFVTLRSTEGIRLKVAVTFFAVVIVTAQAGADPVQAPDHPVNTAP